jgi:hypothetical protein
MPYLPSSYLPRSYIPFHYLPLAAGEEEPVPELDAPVNLRVRVKRTLTITAKNRPRRLNIKSRPNG